MSFKYLLVHLKTEKGNLAVKADVPIMIKEKQNKQSSSYNCYDMKIWQQYFFCTEPTVKLVIFTQLAKVNFIMKVSWKCAKTSHDTQV